MSRHFSGNGRKLVVIATAAAAAAALTIAGTSGRAEAQTGFHVNSADGNSGVSVDFGQLFGAIASSGDGGGGNTYYESTTVINQAPRHVSRSDRNRRHPGPDRYHHRRPGKHHGPGVRAGHGGGHRRGAPVHHGRGDGPKRHHR
ncbi:MAG: hypothetical protein LBT40_01965, partial [Deltaproteobacteria bacterium]|nr:hypothetical protein [Deltaproteobacteria bacterium]